jgi:hypothetical protein
VKVCNWPQDGRLLMCVWRAVAWKNSMRLAASRVQIGQFFESMLPEQLFELKKLGNH